MKTAYLQSRAPLLVNSNWWCVYQPDPSIPTMAPPEPGQYTFWQVRRAAWLVHKMLEYRTELERSAIQRYVSMAKADISRKAGGLGRQAHYVRCTYRTPDMI